MPKFYNIKHDVITALRTSYSDLIETEEELAVRFERVIEFLSHEAQPYMMYKQENDELCACLKNAAKLEKSIIDNHLSVEVVAHETKYRRLLELKSKIENIY